jgi:hypothetical protein
MYQLKFHRPGKNVSPEMARYDHKVNRAYQCWSAVKTALTPTTDAKRLRVGNIGRRDSLYDLGSHFLELQAAPF